MADQCEPQGSDVNRGAGGNGQSEIHGIVGAGRASVCPLEGTNMQVAAVRSGAAGVVEDVVDGPTTLQQEWVAPPIHALGHQERGLMCGTGQKARATELLMIRGRATVTPGSSGRNHPETRQARRLSASRTGHHRKY